MMYGQANIKLSSNYLLSLLIYLHSHKCSYEPQPHPGNYKYKSVMNMFCAILKFSIEQTINPYPTAFPYGNGMVLHFYQQQESSTTKTVHKVINKGLKAYA